MKEKKSANLIIGKALLFAGIQFSLGSVEMSSKFSVANFAKDQDTLDNAAKSLRDYIIIAVIWTIGNCLVFSANYGLFGFIASLLTNTLFVMWIVFSYIDTFKKAAAKNNLKMPKVF